MKSILKIFPKLATSAENTSALFDREDLFIVGTRTYQSIDRGTNILA